jgi:ParB family transcriptional regulator, chromosome partitioning protein
VPSKRPSLRDRPLLPAMGAAAADDLLMGAERRRQEILDLPVGEIMPNRRQPRLKPSDEGLDELSASIREHGILQPILVQSISLRAYEGRPCRYELIAGERRWRASRRAGRDSIPAIILGETADDQQLLLLALIENLQREELSPLDEGLAFAQLQSDFGLTQHEIAERVGKGRGYVQNRVRLTTVADDLQQLAAERPDTIAHIYEIARVDDPDARAALIAAVRDNRISHAATRARVAALLAPPELPAHPLAKNDLRKSLEGVPRHRSGAADTGENDLRKSFGGAPAPWSGAADTGENDLRKSFGGAPAPWSGVADTGENDLRKSFSDGETAFLSPAERAVLLAVLARLEAGVAVPEGEDLSLLLRLSMLVAALLPNEQ